MLRLNDQTLINIHIRDYILGAVKPTLHEIEEQGD